MSLSPKELEQIANLAYLDTQDIDTSKLGQEINSIMDFVDQLRSVDTQHSAPLSHPFALHQALREDVVTEEDCNAQLEAIAPLFEDHLFLVPTVIESGE